MKTFIALTEERYVWCCPYCEDPADKDFVECEHCGEKSKCEYTT